MPHPPSASACGQRFKVPNANITTAEDFSSKVQPLSDAELDAAFSFMFDALCKAHPARREDVAETSGKLRLPLLLAVSGGADSLSLMVLCHEWLERNKLPVDLHVASVDHRLRPEAADECAYVGKLARMRGIEHATLVWEGEKSHSNLQGEARKARYRLLSEHAGKLGCGHIVIAHHQDDQAETLLMRLIRGSGVTGLAAMRPQQAFGAVSLLRPLMAFPKARLKASLEVRSIDWLEDPSNQSPGYMRVRVRSLLPVFAQEGCDSARLAATARRLQRADQALDEIAYGFYLRHIASEPGLSLSVSLADLKRQCEEIRLRLLRIMIARVAGPAYPPREEKLLAIDAALCESEFPQDRVKRTVAACCFEVLDGRLWVYREPGRDRPDIALASPAEVNWLGLYSVKLSNALSGGKPVGTCSDLVLRPLGEDGRRMLIKEGYLFPQERWSGESGPKGIIEALPSVWCNGRPQYVADWPKVEVVDEFEVEFEEKHPNFAANETIE